MEQTLDHVPVTNPMVSKWDREVDVVVAGYGGAGAVAAIEAHDNGAEVLVLESTVKGGGNTAVSFGGFLCPTQVQDAITYITGLYDLSLSEKDDSLIRVFAEESVQNIDWIKGLKEGVEVHAYGGAGYPQIPGAESMKKYIVHGKGKGANFFARNLFGLLSYAVEDKRKIPVLIRTPAKRLVTNNEGAVIGVTAEKDGEPLAVCARRGVILTSGGYEFDTRLLQNSVKGSPIYSIGHPGNRGDGIRMAQKAGADLWHMNGVSCLLGIKVPDFEAALGISFNHPAYIFVDRHGNRFVNAGGIESHAGLLAVDFYDAQSLEYPRIPCYALFDEALRIKGPVSKAAALGAAGVNYTWSKDNSAEIEKGWIIKEGSFQELAEKLNMKPAALEQTVAQWNQDVRNGKDTLYGRDVTAGTGFGIIETPPFYALEMYPCLINTQGGPRRNLNAQVLDPFGQPIPRLYSAGELGSMWGLIYQGAGNIAECIVFGRIAGRNAAAETPWEG